MSSSTKDQILNAIATNSLHDLSVRIVSDEPEAHQLLTYVFASDDWSFGVIYPSVIEGPSVAASSCADTTTASHWTLIDLQEIKYHMERHWASAWGWLANLILASRYLEFLLLGHGPISASRSSTSSSAPCSTKELQDVLFAIPLNHKVDLGSYHIDLLCRLWSLLFSLPATHQVEHTACRCLLRYSNEDLRNSMLNSTVASDEIGSRIALWAKSAQRKGQSDLVCRWTILLYWICVYPCHALVDVWHSAQGRDQNAEMLEGIEDGGGGEEEEKEEGGGGPQRTPPSVQAWRATCPSIRIEKHRGMWDTFFGTFLDLKLLSSVESLRTLFNPRKTKSETLLMPLPTLFIAEEVVKHMRASSLDSSRQGERKTEATIAEAWKALFHYVSEIWAHCVWSLDLTEVALCLGIATLCKVCPKSTWSETCLLSDTLVTNVEKGILLRNTGYRPLNRMTACAVSDNFMHLRMDCLKPQDVNKPLLLQYWQQLAEALIRHKDVPTDKSAEDKSQHDHQPGDHFAFRGNLPIFISLIFTCVRGGPSIQWREVEKPYELKPPYASDWHHTLNVKFHRPSEGTSRLAKEETEGSLHPLGSLSTKDPGISSVETLDHPSPSSSVESLPSPEKPLLEIPAVLPTHDCDRRATLVTMMCGEGTGESNRRDKPLSRGDTQLIKDIRKVHQQVTHPFYPAESLTHCVNRLRAAFLPAEVNTEGASLELRGIVEAVGRRLEVRVEEQRFIYRQAVATELPRFLEDLLLNRLSPAILESGRITKNSSVVLQLNSGVSEINSVGLDLVKVFLNAHAGCTKELLDHTAIALGMALTSMWLAAGISTLRQLDTRMTFAQMHNPLEICPKNFSYLSEDNPLWRRLDEALYFPFTRHKSTQSRLLLNEGLRHAALMLAGVRPLHGQTSQTLPFPSRKVLCTYTLPVCRSLFKCLEQSSVLYDRNAPLEGGPLSLLIQNLSLLIGFGGSVIVNLDLLLVELESSLATFGYGPLSEPLVRRSTTMLAGMINQLLCNNPFFKEITPRSLILRIRKYLSLSMDCYQMAEEVQAAATISASLKSTYQTTFNMTD